MSPDDRAWDAGWDEHARAQRRRMAQLPLWVKLQWLEDAQRLAEHLRRQGRGGRPRLGDEDVTTDR